ncbi:inverse autotransporter beta domain-containing protein [Bordetella pertussis]|uniref:inverse autotransporter beta domain-containing protein n=1 Tax=Bordetella pertussis TaxID=520 RepID=UPI0039B55DBC
MNKNIYRVVWSLVRGAWVVAGEWARAGRKSSSPRRQNRQRARRGVAAMVGGSILAQALLPLSALAQGAPTLRPARVAQEEAGQDAAWTRKLAAQAESLARRQAERQPGARVDGDYLKREAQAQVNDVLRDGVNLARESGLPFLRNLQGGLSHDFESGRTSLQLNTIDEVYRAGRNTGLLQLGAHNQNDRPTANAGAVYRREVNDALMVGANGFLDYEFGKQHLRGSVGLEVIAPEFSLYGNVYAPLSDWKGAKRNNRREEKPASGMDVGVGYRPAFAPGLSLSATHFRWNGAEVDYFDNGRTQAGAKGFKVGVEYRPVSLVSVGLEQTKVIGGGRETRMQLGLNINLSEPLSKQLRRDASGTPAFSPDARRHALVERENRIVLNTRRKEIIILPLVVSKVSTLQADGRVTVIGATQPFATVTVRMPDGMTGTATADASGRFAYTSAGDQPSGVLALRARNAEGDSSREVTYRYVDEVVLGDLQVAVMALVPLPADRALEVRGKTEPKVDVKVSFSNGESVLAKADAKGLFTVRSTRKVTQGKVLVQATHPQTRKEARAVADYLPPATLAPTIDAVTAQADTGRVTVTGQAEPGAQVDVHFPDGTAKTVDAGADGAYAATSDGDMVSGDIHAQATDKAGNQSPEATRHYGDTTDITPPAAPTIANVATDATSGRVTAAGMAEPGANVTVNFPDGTRKTVVAGGDGAYTATSDRDMVSGDIRVQATDKAGNQSPEATRAYADAVDRTAPEVPTVTHVATDAKSGRITVTGMAEPGANVTVNFPDGTRKTAVAGGDGAYTATSDGDMVSGDIRVQATDKAGNRSPEATRAYADTVDTTPPAVPTITDVTTDATNGRITVTGVAEPGANVTVDFPDGTRKTVVAGGDGAYTATSDRDMASGDVRVQAIDKGGNRSPEATRAYADTVDKTAPAAPTITNVTTDAASGRITVTGMAEPGANVAVNFPDGTRKTVVADGAGAYAADSDGDMVAGDIHVQATDKAGNRSPEGTRAYVDTVDKTPSAAPTIVRVTTDRSSGVVTVAGTADPDNDVTVQFPDGGRKTVKAGKDGSYSVTSDNDIFSGIIQVSARNPAGNASPEVRQDYRDEFVPANAITNIETNSRNGIVTVSGKTSPDATVVVSFPGGDEARTRAKGDGTFSVSSPMDIPRGVVSLSTEVNGVQTVVATRTYEDKFTKGGLDFTAFLPYTPKFNGVSTSDTSAVLLSIPRYFYSGGAPVAKIMPPEADGSEFAKRAAAAMRAQVTPGRDSSEYDVRVSWPAGTFTPADVGQRADLAVKVFDKGTGKYMLLLAPVNFPY